MDKVISDNMSTNYDEFVAELECKKDEPEVTKSLGFRSSTSLSLFISKLKRKKCKSTAISPPTTAAAATSKNPLVTPQVKNRKSLFGYSSRRINKFCKTCNKKRDDNDNNKNHKSLNETYIKEPKQLTNVTDDVKIRKTQSEKKNLKNKMCKLGKDSRKLIHFNKVVNTDEPKQILVAKTPTKELNTTVTINNQERTPFKFCNKNISTVRLNSPATKISQTTPLLKTRKIRNERENKENLHTPIPMPRAKIVPLKDLNRNESRQMPPNPMPRSLKKLNKNTPIRNENQSIKSSKSKIPRLKPHQQSMNSGSNRNKQNSPPSSIKNNTTCQSNNEIIYEIPNGGGLQNNRPQPPGLDNNDLKTDEELVTATATATAAAGENGDNRNNSGRIIKNFLFLSWTEESVVMQGCKKKDEEDDCLANGRALSMIDLAIQGLYEIDSKVQAIKDYF